MERSAVVESWQERKLRIRVLHIANTARLSGGGISEVARNLFTHQRALGANVSLWFPGSLQDENEIREMLNGSGRDVRAISMHPGSGVSIRKRVGALWSEVGRFDVIHQHGIWLPTSVLTWHAGGMVPTVISPHGAFHPYARKVSKAKKAVAWWAYERWNFGRADRLCVCSSLEMEEVENAGLKNRMVVIGNGVSDDCFLESAERAKCASSFRQDFEIKKGQRFFLFLSRLHRIKGVEVLLEAVDLVADKLKAGDWQLLIAGDGENAYIEFLREIVRARGIQDLVRFVGPLYGADKISAYCAGEFFVLPSFGENFGIVVAEAMATGLPVVTSRHMPWQVSEDGGFGIVVNTNAESVAGAIDSLISLDGAQREAMGVRARDFAEKRLRWSGVAEEMLGLYEELIRTTNKRNRRPARGVGS